MWGEEQQSSQNVSGGKIKMKSILTVQLFHTQPTDAKQQRDDVSMRTD